MRQFFIAFVTYPIPVQCWSMSGFDSIAQKDIDFFTWMQDMVQKYTRDELSRIIMVYLSLWKNRNDILWSQHSVELSDIVKATKIFLNH